MGISFHSSKMMMMLLGLLFLIFSYAHGFSFSQRSTAVRTYLFAESGDLSPVEPGALPYAKRVAEDFARVSFGLASDTNKAPSTCSTDTTLSPSTAAKVLAIYEDTNFGKSALWTRLNDGEVLRNMENLVAEVGGGEAAATDLARKQTMILQLESAGMSSFS